MADRRKRLTKKFIQEVCDRIRAGAYDHVACESLGVSFSLFQKWLELGQSETCRSKLPPLLVEAVRQAKAHARFMAEMRIRSDQPRTWLIQGPGKETAEVPGWTSPVKAGAFRPAIDWQTTIPPEAMALLNALHEALKPFPEARAAVGDVLIQFKLPPQTEE